MMLYWVMGGTAVGKKRFIDRVVDGAIKILPDGTEFRGSIQRVWYEDGCMESAELLARCQQASVSMIRWQWGREEVLAHIARVEKCVPMKIILVETPEHRQYHQMLKREGEPKWPSRMLADGSFVVRGMAKGLSVALQVPLIHLVYTGGQDEYCIGEC